jgi:hypothetical protein
MGFYGLNLRMAYAKRARRESESRIWWMNSS